MGSKAAAPQCSVLPGPGDQSSGMGFKGVHTQGGMKELLSQGYLSSWSFYLEELDPSLPGKERASPRCPLWECCVAPHRCPCAAVCFPLAPGQSSSCEPSLRSSSWWRKAARRVSPADQQLELSAASAAGAWPPSSTLPIACPGTESPNSELELMPTG